MTTALVRKPPSEALAQLEQVVLRGDLANLTENERIGYYARVCESLGLNPLTRPFEYITLNNKLTLYVRKDATDQLRDLHGVSIPRLERERDDEHGLYTVIAYAIDRYGREDSGMGVVSIKGLVGEALANAMMKAETKGKRRATLSICGLGWMDEVEALDARAVEVAPRQALASGIRARTQALESGTRESPDEVVSMSSAADVPPVAAGDASSPSELAAPTPDEAAAHEHVGTLVMDDGLYCECGELVAKRQPKARTRKAKAKQPGDEGYGTARAHAVAAERGLDHDAVHRIGWELVGRPLDEDFSVSNFNEDLWAEVIAAISEAPVPTSDAVAETWAGRMALQAGIGSGDDPWTEADPMLAEMFGHGDPYSAAELIEFGIRVYARNPLP